MPRRKILICVSGLTPQIVTETVYALAVTRPSPWVPDEVWLLTTVLGANKAKTSLLCQNQGWFTQLLQDWNLPDIDFDESHIKILTDPLGKPLSDIRDDEDNHAAADAISNFVRELTSNENSEIQASIAGGRKTMGFFMGYAMSLWGRAQDSLSHVLVSAPFESRPDFFYPTPYPKQLDTAAADTNAISVDASTAQVWLGDIPFVRLRSLLPDSFKAQDSSFDAAVQAANRALAELTLEVDVSRSTLVLNGMELRVPPLQFSLICVLAHRSLHDMPPLRAPLIEIDDPEWKAEVYQCLANAVGHERISSRVRARLKGDQPIGSSFNEQISKLERLIEKSGAIPFRRLVKREVDGKGRQRVYRLDVDKRSLRIHIDRLSANSLSAARNTPEGYAQPFQTLGQPQK